MLNFDSNQLEALLVKKSPPFSTSLRFDSFLSISEALSSAEAPGSHGRVFQCRQNPLRKVTAGKNQMGSQQGEPLADLGHFLVHPYRFLVHVHQTFT